MRKKKVFREEYCMEPIEGPAAMATQVEQLIDLILEITSQGSDLSAAQIRMLDEIFNKIEFQSARGASFGNAVGRAIKSFSERLMS